MRLSRSVLSGFVVWVAVCLLSCGDDALSPTPGTPLDAGDEAQVGETSAPETGAESSTLQVQNLEALSVSPRNVRIAWQALPGAEIVLQREETGKGNWAEVARVQGERTRFLDLALTPQTSYRYKVQACAEGTCGPALETPSTTTPSSEVPTPTITVPYEGPNEDVVVFGTARVGDDYLGNGRLIGVDRNGTIVWERESKQGITTAAKALPDGTLGILHLITLEQIALDGAVLATFSSRMAHHDFQLLSDGRLIYLYWDLFKDGSTDLMGDGIEMLGADLQPQWNWLTRGIIPLADVCTICLTVPYTPGNTLGKDWTHANAVYFDEQAQKVYVNVRNLNRIYKIDYPSGKVDWILGDGGDFGAGLWAHSHDPHYLPNNRIVMFDNGLHRGGEPEWSRVIEIAYDPTAKTAEIVWEYRETPDFYNTAIGGVYLEENGNRMISDGVNGRLVDVTLDKQKVWEARLPTPWALYKAIVLPRSFFTEW